VAIALWRSPDFNVALAELGLARADLQEAGLLRNHVLSLLFPLGPKQLEFTLAWPLEALWQRPKRIEVAEREAERIAVLLVKTGLDLTRDVKVAHAELLLATERSRLAEEARTVRGRIAAIAEARLRVGDISPLQAVAARVDLARAEDEAARAAHEEQSARNRLRFLLGLSPEEPLEASASPEGTPALHDVETLVRDALAARPELRAVELAMEAAGGRAGLARSEVLALSAVLDANEEGKEGFEAGPGLVVELPLFGRNKGRVARAEAELERETRRYAAERDRIALEVREAHMALQASTASLAVWESRILPTLEEGVARAEKALQLGEASPLEVLEARRALLEARFHAADARTSVTRAEAAVAHSVGWSPGRGFPPSERTENP
jgi:cobalt-zinc-cadmium efflux system outer membrane protein